MFADAVATSFAVPILVIQGISIIVFLLITLEFRHIHSKRIAFMRALGSSNISGEMLEKNFLIILYAVMTAVVLLISLLSFR